MTKSFALSSLSIALVALAGSANAVEFKAGDTTVTVGGIVNTYFTYSDCSGNQAISGIALGTEGFGCGGNDSSVQIGNGLLPNYLNVGMKTTQAGIDIGATIGIGSAVGTNSQIGNNNNVDVRQGFATFGTASAGTIKFGRDYGYFGKNAILSDMTLLGVGIADRATQNGGVSLGHIGAGYTYLGTYGMIAYTTPNLSGFSGTFALVNPVDDGGPADDSPQIQLLGEFKLSSGKVWAAFKHQKFRAAGATPSFETQGYEVGGSYTIAGLNLLANFQGGDALGILADGDSGDVEQTNFLLQGTYNVTPAAKVGLSYGESKLDDGAGTGLEKNSNLTAGVYYSLTPALTLVGEISQTESEAFNGNKAKLKGYSLGAFLFF